jgi:hypothetical protein
MNTPQSPLSDRMPEKLISGMSISSNLGRSNSRKFLQFAAAPDELTVG